MTTNPPPLPLYGPQEQKDEDHLKLLSVFHFVLGGLALLGIGFLLVHYFIMSRVFMDPEMWKGPNSQPPPKEFFKFFVWFYFIMGGMLVVGGVLNVVAGFFLQRKTQRTFCLVIAGLNCLQIPFGTVLGVFTITVLARDSVRRAFET